MKKVLILCAANPANNPRPNRMIKLLKNDYDIYAMGINSTPIEGIKTLSYPSYKKRNLLEEIKLFKNVFLKKYNDLIYTNNRLEISKVLKNSSFDLIICHDLVLLPIVLKDKKKAKVLFDAREFYPAQNSSNIRWRILFSKFNDFLCKKYLPQADKIITVSNGLAQNYQKFYNIKPDIFLSLPQYYDISPKIPDFNEIKIIYHGAANPNRKIQTMINVIDYLNPNFSIDLMLINTDERYMAYLKKLVEKKQSQNKKISIIPPVKFQEIIPFTSQYDLGLYAIPPTTLNIKHALPNKFFEYIQARLGLIITPNVEMMSFIKKYKNGMVAKSFSPKIIAKTINELNITQIQNFKLHSELAAKHLNINSNKELLIKIMEQLNI